MAELGVLSSVAGLVSLGITVSQGILDYYEAYRGFQDHVKGLCESIEALGRTLVAILNISSGGNLLSNDILDIVARNVRACQSGIEQLQRKLDKIKMVPSDSTLKSRFTNTKRRTLYPFRESTLIKMREICNELRDDLSLSIDALHIDIGTVTLERLQSLALTSNEIRKDIGQVDRKLSKMSIGIDSFATGQHRELLAKIYSWLTPLSTVFGNKQRETFATKSRQDGAARALLERDQFIGWKSSVGTILWCTGLPGTGKTVIASFIIDSLLQGRNIDSYGVAFIYFSYKDAEIQTPVNLMASLLQQLVSQKPEHLSILRGLYDRHIQENTRPDVSEICQLLQAVIWSFPKVLIIIDALDECSDADDARFILLAELRKFKSRISLLIMSRPLPSLEKGLEDAVRVHTEASESDIMAYLEQRLASVTTLQKHFVDEPSLKDTIISRIILKIKGMFLMARLYLDTLTTKITRRKIKAALDSLPEGLNSVYDELMIRIRVQNPRDHADLAIRVLGWIFYAVRPLTVQELQYALAIEVGDRDLDGDGIPDSETLVSVCAGMVTINPESETITLVHFTAQEYFQHDGMHILEHAHQDISRTCLSYLLFDNFDLEIDDGRETEIIQQILVKHALLSYSAQYWGDHARYTEDETIIELAFELLEDERRVHLAVQVKDYVDAHSKGDYFRPRYKVRGLSLAASFGLTAVVKEMLLQGSDINSVDSNKQHALFHAVENAHTETARLLLDEGAEINAGDSCRWTVLHHACANGQIDLTKLLLQKGAAINAVDGYGATPLYRAADSGAEAVVRLLLSKYADVSVKNSYLQTALHRAADQGHGGIVELLLKHGADVTVKDYFGYTPLYRALDQGYEDIAKLLRGYADL